MHAVTGTITECKKPQGSKGKERCGQEKRRKHKKVLLNTSQKEKQVGNNRKVEGQKVCERRRRSERIKYGGAEIKKMAVGDRRD